MCTESGHIKTPKYADGRWPMFPHAASLRPRVLFGVELYKVQSTFSRGTYQGTPFRQCRIANRVGCIHGSSSTSGSRITSPIFPADAAQTMSFHFYFYAWTSSTNPVFHPMKAIPISKGHVRCLLIRGIHGYWLRP